MNFWFFKWKFPISIPPFTAQKLSEITSRMTDFFSSNSRFKSPTINLELFSLRKNVNFGNFSRTFDLVSDIEGKPSPKTPSNSRFLRFSNFSMEINFSWTREISEDSGTGWFCNGGAIDRGDRFKVSSRWRSTSHLSDLGSCRECATLGAYSYPQRYLYRYD